MRQPFFCNVAAQAAAVESLKHQDEIARRVERNLAERMELEDGLRAPRARPGAVEANFVWFDVPEEPGDRESSRRWPSAASSSAPARALGREGALRVTVGTEAENRKFLAALGALLG